MHSLNYLFQLPLFALVVVFEKVDHVSLFEEPEHPIFLAGVLEHSISIENPRLELPDVEVAVLEELVPKTVEMRVDHVASLHHSQLELILVSMRIRVVATVATPKN